MILFKDAAREKAVGFVVGRAFINGGQYCTTLKRAYIHREIYDPVKKMILERMPEVQVGDPRDPKTRIGPIKVERTRKLLDRALAALRTPTSWCRPAGTGSGRGRFCWRPMSPRTPRCSAPSWPW